MMVAHSIFSLREELRFYVRRYAPDIDSFCGKALMEDHQTAFIAPQRLKGTEAFLAAELLTSELSRPVVEAVRSAVNDVCWRQSYGLDDANFDQDYLDNYGWFNLISPSGPFISDSLRLSIGFWGQGLHYPHHWHEPEEIYLTLGGTAIYISEGRASVEGGPGTTICHYSNQSHALDFSKAPLLVAAFWRGGELEAKPRL